MNTHVLDHRLAHAHYALIEEIWLVLIKNSLFLKRFHIKNVVRILIFKLTVSETTCTTVKSASKDFLEKMPC